MITRTPDHNPNYFFSDYQQAGDIYSLPQAHTHQNNWRRAAESVQRYGVRVVNLSPISRIDAFERKSISEVFDFVTAAEVDARHSLSALGFRRPALVLEELLGN